MSDFESLTLEEKPGQAGSALKFDPRAYSHFLKDSGWTEAQKDEFTEALWRVIVEVIDTGFSINPVQQAMSESALVPDSDTMLSSSLNVKPNETQIAGGETRPARETES